MNYELLIARRILFDREARNKMSRPVIRIAILSVALGLALMVVAVAVITGFRKEIREKIIGFGAHIQVGKYDTNESLETLPIETDSVNVSRLLQISGVRHVQQYGAKAGIIKTKADIEGVVLKGVAKDFDWQFFKKNLKQGNVLELNDSTSSDQLIVSVYLASKLGLKLRDKVVIYFLQDKNLRGRPFFISGLYETGLGEQFDPMVVLGDLRHIRKINGWKNTQVTGFELLIDDFNNLDRITSQVNETIPYDMQARSIRDIYPQIFDWLRLQDKNVEIIIVLMVLVAAINMIVTLLILILEHAAMTGILKSLGAYNWSIRRVFLYAAAYIISLGLLFGNVAGIGLTLLQKFTRLIKLDQESYYVAYVPVNISITDILLLNTGTLLVCLFVLIIPTYVIAKILPVKVLRFE